jgi:hypothetical protein
MRLTFLFILVLGGCGKDGSNASNSNPKSENVPSSQPALEEPPCGIGLKMSASASIGTLNGESIPCSAVYERTRAKAEDLEAKYKTKLYFLHEQGLKDEINDRLLKAAASKAKLSIPDFIGSAVVAAPATEEDIKEAYKTSLAKGQKLPPLKKIRDELREFVTTKNQKKALATFRARLRSEATIKSNLPKPPKLPEPPKAEVEDATKEDSPKDGEKQP